EKLEKDEMNIPGTKVMAEDLIKYARVYVNILEIGLFQYITCSHRSRKDFKKINNNDIKSDLEIPVKLADIEWVVIPELLEYYGINEFHEKRFKVECEDCKDIENTLNNT
ncbi:24825_t:CDS:1, partial [Racocetra persica]